MNILFVTEIAPFPPNSGERIRSYNLINSILDFADELILVSDNAPPDEERYKNVTHIQFPKIYSKSRWVSLFQIFFRNRSFSTLLRGLMDDHQIDLVIMDYNFIGNYIKVFKRRGVKVIYGTHNVQSRLDYQKPATILKDILFKNLCYLFELVHELYFFRQADSLIAVSDDDLTFYERYYKRPRLYMIPNYIDEKEYQGTNHTPKKNQVVMTGTFLAFQNNEGLRWFLEEVWDDHLASLSNLIVVGRGSLEQFDMLIQKNPSVKNAEALGCVDDIKQYITESKVAIIPLHHGSGTRLKCIEAMALKTNIVGTTLGVQGIKHNGTILTADDSAGFKEHLVKVLSDEVHLEEEAFKVFLETYSSHSNTPRIKEMAYQTYYGDKHSE